MWLQHGALCPDKVEITNQRPSGSSVDAHRRRDELPRQPPAADWKQQFQIVPMRVGSVDW
jgi:hypothetical protein